MFPFGLKRPGQASAPSSKELAALEATDGPLWPLSQLAAARWRGGCARPHPPRPQPLSSIRAPQILPSGVSRQDAQAPSPAFPWPQPISLCWERMGGVLACWKGGNTRALQRLAPSCQQRPASEEGLEVNKVLKASLCDGPGWGGWLGTGLPHPSPTIITAVGLGSAPLGNWLITGD